MVERFHHSLKAALTARCQDGRWRKELPWILLEPRTALNALATEALYRQSLATPADVFQGPNEPTTSSNICRAVAKIMPARKKYFVAKKSYIPAELQCIKYVFVRIDAHRRPSLLLTQDLTPSCNVNISAMRCHWMEELPGSHRLKPAYILKDDSSS
ncbi:uncharacterized protein [Macrobrachium rosenbergii]|uniref:uncharacterized protein n=1 Tax=Macrobrachium rosenbergii TaxID=79674 RepID=UPI0034D4370B